MSKGFEFLSIQFGGLHSSATQPQPFCPEGEDLTFSFLYTSQASLPIRYKLLEVH